MALIIDERVAGGRPSKLPQPTTATVTASLSQASDVLARAGKRALRARLIVAWARL